MFVSLDNGIMESKLLISDLALMNDITLLTTEGTDISLKAMLQAYGEFDPDIIVMVLSNGGLVLLNLAITNSMRNRQHIVEIIRRMAIITN